MKPTTFIKKTNLELSRELEVDSKLLDSIISGLGSKRLSKEELKAKIAEKLDANKVANLLAYKEAKDQGIKQEQNKFAEFIFKKNLFEDGELESFLPNHKEFDFLSELKKNPSEFEALKSKHFINKEDLKSLEDRKLIISLDHKEKHKLLGDIDESEAKELRKQGLISYLSPEECKQILRAEHPSESCIKQRLEEIGISSKEFGKLKNMGVIYVLSDKEHEVLTRFNKGLLNADALESMIADKGVSKQRIFDRIHLDSKTAFTSARIATDIKMAEGPVANYFEPNILQAKLRDFDTLKKEDLFLFKEDFHGNKLDENRAYRLNYIKGLSNNAPAAFGKQVAKFLSPKQIATYLDSRLNESEVPKETAHLSRFLDNVSTEKLQSMLPTATELVYLSKLKSGLAQPAAIMLADEYKVDFSSLVERDLIQAPQLKLEYQEFFDELGSMDSDAKPKSINELIGFGADYGIAEEELRDLVKSGTIRILSENESRLVESIKQQVEKKTTPNVRNLAEQNLVSSSRLEKFKQYGIIDYLEEADIKYLDALASGKKEKIDEVKEGLSIGQIKRLKERIIFHNYHEVKSIDMFGYPSKEESSFLYRYKEISQIEDAKVRTDKIKELEKESEFDKKELYKLKNRLQFFKQDEIKEIDYRIKTTQGLLINKDVSANYKESDALLTLRSSQNLDHSVEQVVTDDYLLMHEELGSKNELSYANKVRKLELKLVDKKLDHSHILANNEKAFINSLLERKFTKDPTADLGSVIAKDFDLKPERAQQLVASGILSIENKSEKNKPSFKVVTQYKEPEELSNARICLNSSDKDGLEPPSKTALNLIEGKANKFELQPKQIDYSLYFKVIRAEQLSFSEKRRAELLAENGMDLNSKQAQKWVHEEPKSYQMKGARKNAFLNHYQKTYGVSRQALDWTNRFKQLSTEQLKNYLNVSPDDLRRYTQGIKGKNGDYTGKFPLLTEHREPTRNGIITYYTLAHEGPISGRAFMEKYYPKEKIAKSGQTRNELIPHDLKVVDCVWKVKCELERKNTKILNIKNEATQYGDEKRGIVNEKRQHGPSFMDAVIMVDEQVPIKSGGTRSKVIAIEYGNYSVERMEDKITNSHFDEAHIFASPQYIQQYIKHIGYVPGVRFRSI